MGFLQRYYHKGAFMLSAEVEAAVARQDRTAATGADVVDKASLPKVMQGEWAGMRALFHLRNFLPLPRCSCVPKFSRCHAPRPLPGAGAVKKFGFAGQTKYTHLKDQDTTDFSAGAAVAWRLRPPTGSRSR